MALGYGFRCGFLGLLHMEIIQERLEREFDLDLVTTAPSVVYHVIKTDGGEDRHRQPHQSARRCRRSTGWRSPSWTRRSSRPRNIVGAIMELCQDKRGVFRDMKYIDGGRVVLNYDLPLNEVIYDFFDQLKSRTRGYASFDYELKGYVSERSGQAGHAAQRRACATRCPSSSTRDRAYARGPLHRRKAQGRHPAPDV